MLTGGSMGGQQSLVLAGLRPEKITAVLVCVPAGADANGDLHGRKAGYPNWPSDNPDVMKTAILQGREFYDTEPSGPNGKSILVRFVWSKTDTNSPHFEQSFSEDGGKTWEVNWITDQTRLGDEPGKAH